MISELIKKENIILFLIILIAAFLRIWKLDAIPPGIHMDESLTGYTAYSILNTGLDLHGVMNWLSLSDTNVGGTYPPLYTYILIPFVKLFGLNIFIDRLPAALFGIGTVFITFFVVKKLIMSNTIALLSAFLLAINPWAIHIARQGLLESISLFFVMAGILFFLYARNYFTWSLSALMFGFSLFAYDAPRLFVLPLLLALGIYRKSEIVRSKKYFSVFIGILLLFYIFLGWGLFSQGESEEYARANPIDIQSISRTVDNERYLSNAPLWLSSIFHTKLSVAVKNIQTTYFSIFSVNWFFVNGSGNLQHAVANHGEFYLFEMPFFFVGIYLLFKKNSKLALFFLTWMFLGALPAGLSSGNHAYRAVNMLPVPIVFSSIGIFWFFKKGGQVFKKYNFLAIAGFVVIAFVYTASYLFTYFFDYPVYASEYWAKQQNDTLKYAVDNQHKYNKIFIDGSWETMFAFIMKTNPSESQSAYKNQEKYKETKVIKLGKFYFGNYTNLEQVKSPQDYFPQKSLLITSGTKFKGALPLKSFKDPGGVRVIFNAFSIN